MTPNNSQRLFGACGRINQQQINVREYYSNLKDGYLSMTPVINDDIFA